jgi:Ca2+/H+ antiporter, TMEM165/GDT1 family
VDETFGPASWLGRRRLSSSVRLLIERRWTVDLGVAGLVFGIILLAELPDKTMFASLLLGTRYAARWVFLGAAAAFLIHVVIAVTAGSLLALLPKRIVELVVAVLFVMGAALLWHASRSNDEGDVADSQAGERGTSAWAGLVSSFVVIFLGEWGDITQLATANLAARYHNALSVGVGAVLGLWTAALLAITAGRTLLRFLSVTVLHRIGAAVFAALAIFSLVEAVR